MIETSGLWHFEAKELLNLKIEVPFYVKMTVYESKHTNIYGPFHKRYFPPLVFFLENEQIYKIFMVKLILHIYETTLKLPDHTT